MEKEYFKIENIPAILWGENSEKIYIYVHGKNGNKEEAESFCDIANKKGFQVLSFDLAEHGERKNEDCPNNIWNGIKDLKIIANYVIKNWDNINLYSVSLGVYYSLMAYKDLPIKNCLFVSPILDMKLLIENMMLWAGIDDKILKQKETVVTNFGEILDWEYYSFVKENPIVNWKPKTNILYGMKDNMTSFDTIMEFTKRFNCQLSTQTNMEHYLHREEDIKILREWEIENL